MVNFCTDCKHYLQDVHEEELGFCARFRMDVGLESTPLKSEKGSEGGCFEERRE